MANKNEILETSIVKLFKSDNNNNYIFIYTPPKVGSTTLVSSLRISLGKSYSVVHIHDDVMLSVLTGISNITVNEIIHYLSSIGKNVYVIDVYRTPIERKMSEFFEKISPYHFNNTEENINKYSIQRVSERFNKLFPHLENGDHYIDKYNIVEPVSFDFSKKYTLQIINNIKYVKLRLCDSKSWGGILSSILQSEIIIISDYKTDTKEIGDLYNRFKNEYRLPSNYFELIKDCKYFNFYYSDEERNNYLAAWKIKLCDPVVSYTSDEYKFYIRLCLENQYINDIQSEHYIDNGCYCKCCTEERKKIFYRAKKGEKKFKKMVHIDVILEKQQTIKNKLISEITNKNLSSQVGKKFKPKQFKIKPYK
jgi:hypothetical protein